MAWLTRLPGAEQGPGFRKADVDKLSAPQEATTTAAGITGAIQP